MSLEDLVSVNISIESAGLAAQGFGVPMIVGLHTRFIERFRTYSNLSAMLTDGFIAADPEYVAATNLLSQEKRPLSFLVGRRAAAVAQVDRLDIVGTTDGAWSFTLNGELVTFTAASNTTAQIRDGLISAANALTGAGAPITAAIVDGDTLSLTADVAGIPFTVGAVTAPSPGTLTRVASVANVGIETDLSAIQDAGAAWYLTVLAGNATASASGRTEAVILRAAAWHQANTTPLRHLLLAQANDANAPLTPYDSVTPNDIAEQLRAIGYTRTALVWHERDAEYVDAAWAGRMLPEDPGTETWAWKALVGPLPIGLSQSQRENLTGGQRIGPGGKNANVYYALSAETSRMWKGVVANGLWIDVVRYVDSLHARLQVACANFVLGQTGKVAYTAAGIEGLAAQVRAVLEGDRVAGKLAPVVSADGRILVPAYSVTSPDLATISLANRQARVLPPITFTARLSGALHELDVNGTVAQ
jgi:hypothetical protein